MLNQIENKHKSIFNLIISIFNIFSLILFIVYYLTANKIALMEKLGDLILTLLVLSDIISVLQYIFFKNNSKSKVINVIVSFLFIFFLIALPRSIGLPAPACGNEKCFTYEAALEVSSYPYIYYTGLLLVFSIYCIVLNINTIKEVQLSK